MLFYFYFFFKIKYFSQDQNIFIQDKNSEDYKDLYYKWIF